EQFYHHRKMVKDLFGKEMRGLFPPELVFTAQKSYLLSDLDIDYSIIEGSHEIFHTDDIEGIWKTKAKKPVYLVPRNRALSWHFSDSDFPNAKWMLNKINEKNGPVTIGCDVECFGHHRGADSFKFLDYFIKQSKDNHVDLLRAEDIVKKYKQNASELTDETITTWARSINVFFPHAKIIEMWFAKNDAVSTYYRVEYLYFKLEAYFKEKKEKNKDLQKLFDKLVDIKMKKLDEIRWAIYRELTDAALYHEDFSNENTYRAMLDKCGWIKNQLWEVEKELSKIMMSI
ncbi:MAG: hypothetical protein FK733_11045, partial [Asgard group archaeon]|nr:hypothetical protein [Asgard group archaeon]